jgi:hypothetical protein
MHVTSMPNLPERVQVMLTPATAATIKRLARLQGRSRSAVVREFLDEVAPVLDRTANLLELALTAQGKWPAELVAKLERIQNGLESHALLAMDGMDVTLADGLASRREASGRPRPATNPPASNRGVTPTHRKRKLHNGRH